MARELLSWERPRWVFTGPQILRPGYVARPIAPDELLTSLMSVTQNAHGNLFQPFYDSRSVQSL